MRYERRCMESDLQFSQRGMNVDARDPQAIEYIEAHLDAPMTVAEIANHVFLSPAHFRRVFKAGTGEAVWVFVQRRRIERAMAMLEQTDRPIVDIANQCGFAHQAHLTRLFKRRFGITPGRVRSDANSARTISSSLTARDYSNSCP